MNECLAECALWCAGIFDHGSKWCAAVLARFERAAGGQCGVYGSWGDAMGWVVCIGCFGVGCDVMWCVERRVHFDTKQTEELCHMTLHTYSPGVCLAAHYWGVDTFARARACSVCFVCFVLRVPFCPTPHSTSTATPSHPLCSLSLDASVRVFGSFWLCVCVRGLPYLTHYSPHPVCRTHQAAVE